jgi:replicative DNA helicase
VKFIRSDKWFDVPDEKPEVIWGNGDDILWSNGEPLIIAGPTGAGKTSIAGQLIAGLLGIDNFGELFGFTITQQIGHGEKLLYLALDRPKQARRALARQLGSQAAKVQTDDRLHIGRGAFDFKAFTETLIESFVTQGVKVIVIDSLKDILLNPTDDTAAGEWNRVQQSLTAAGIELLILHHNRKQTRTPQGTKLTRDINDIYGSSKIVWGVGSVVSIEPVNDDDNERIRVRHLKPVINVVKTFEARHDHHAGRTYRIGSKRDDEIIAAIGDGARTSELNVKLGCDDATSKKALQRDLRKLADSRRIEKNSDHNPYWTVRELNNLMAEAV